jgi:thiamine biosynthesis lipoprotein
VDGPAGWVDVSFPVMGTLGRLRLRGPEPEALAADCRDLLRELEGLWSRFAPGSDVARLNAARGAGGAAVAVDPRTDALLSAAARLSRRTGGRFSPAIGARLTRQEGGRWRVRESGGGAGGRGDGIVGKVGGGSVGRGGDGGVGGRGDGIVGKVGGGTVDLGGIAKGRAADAARDLAARRGARAALVSLGTSSVAVLGERPGGGPWRVGLRPPGGAADTAFGVVEVGSGAVSTSGDYARAEGLTVDPRTGEPAASGVRSASVLAADGAAAEAYSTAFLVGGCELALALYGEGGEFEAVLVTDQAVVATPGLRGRFTAGAAGIRVIGGNSPHSTGAPGPTCGPRLLG